MVNSQTLHRNNSTGRHHSLPEVVIWRAIRRYKIRRVTEQIRIKDKWLFEVALNGKLSMYHWPLLMHAPATLNRVSHFLEDLGALRKNSSAHARILVISLLLAGLRPQTETPLIHNLAYCMAQLCDQPESITHRAMFISLYPQVCHYILQNFDNVLLEIRTAANRRGSLLALPVSVLDPTASPTAATTHPSSAVICTPKQLGVESKQTLAMRTQLRFLISFLSVILRYIWIIYNDRP